MKFLFVMVIYLTSVFAEYIPTTFDNDIREVCEYHMHKKGELNPYVDSFLLGAIVFSFPSSTLERTHKNKVIN